MPGLGSLLLNCCSPCPYDLSHWDSPTWPGRNVPPLPKAPPFWCILHRFLTPSAQGLTLISLSCCHLMILCLTVAAALPPHDLTPLGKCRVAPVLNLGNIFVFNVKIIYHLWAYWDSSVVFSHHAFIAFGGIHWRQVLIPLLSYFPLWISISCRISCV